MVAAKVSVTAVAAMAAAEEVLMAASPLAALAKAEVEVEAVAVEEVVAAAAAGATAVDRLFHWAASAAECYR